MSIFKFHKRKPHLLEPEGHKPHEFGAFFFNIERRGISPFNGLTVTPYSRLTPLHMMNAWAVVRQQLLPIADDDIYPICQSDIRPIRIYLGFTQGTPDDALTLRIEPDEVTLEMASNVIHLGYHTLDQDFGSFKTCLIAMLRKGHLIHD